MTLLGTARGTGTKKRKRRVYQGPDYWVLLMSNMSVRRILVDGTTIGAFFSAVALTSLLVEPMAWVGDYPPDVQAAASDLPSAGLTFIVMVAGALGMVILGGLWWSLRRLGQENARLRFSDAALHAFLVLWVVNVFDLVITDWLLFMHVFRRWVVLPGTEGLAGYRDYFFHFRVSFLEAGPWIASVVLSLGAGLAWWLLAGRKRARIQQMQSGSP